MGSCILSRINYCISWPFQATVNNGLILFITNESYWFDKWKQQVFILFFKKHLPTFMYLMESVVTIIVYYIISRSVSFCAKPRDWRPKRSWGRQLGEAQKELLLIYYKCLVIFSNVFVYNFFNQLWLLNFIYELKTQIYKFVKFWNKTIFWIFHNDVKLWPD
jgi:hypothetical protein